MVLERLEDCFVVESNFVGNIEHHSVIFEYCIIFVLFGVCCLLLDG